MNATRSMRKRATIVRTLSAALFACRSGVRPTSDDGASKLTTVQMDTTSLDQLPADLRKLISGYRLVIEPIDTSCAGTKIDRVQADSDKKISEKISQTCDYSVGLEIGQIGNGAMGEVYFSNLPTPRSGKRLNKSEIIGKPTVEVILDNLVVTELGKAKGFVPLPQATDLSIKVVVPGTAAPAPTAPTGPVTPTVPAVAGWCTALGQDWIWSNSRCSNSANEIVISTVAAGQSVESRLEVAEMSVALSENLSGNSAGRTSWLVLASVKNTSGATQRCQVGMAASVKNEDFTGIEFCIVASPIQLLERSIAPGETLSLREQNSGCYVPEASWDRTSRAYVVADCGTGALHPVKGKAINPPSP